MPNEETVPTVRDSDVILMVTKRLDLVAEKMMRLEYDHTLERWMKEAGDLFQYLQNQIEKRNAA